MLACSTSLGRWPLAEALEISRGRFTHLEALQVRLVDGRGHTGRGEAVGVDYEGETPQSLADRVAALAPQLHDSTSHDDLAHLLPAGGARNALDCALWELRARQTGRRVWELAGLPEPRPVVTAFTIGLGDPGQVRRKVRAARHMPLLKLKLDATRHLEPVRLAREEHPQARLMVDANQAWSPALLENLLEPLHALGVELIEQPLPRGQDARLDGLGAPVALAADESCTDAASLDALVGRYQVVNIKLDKCGGLSEALRMLRRARELGLQAMVGSMGGSSLGVAAAFLVAQQCRFVDLDVPLLLAQDGPHALVYDGATVPVPPAALWG